MPPAHPPLHTLQRAPTSHIHATTPPNTSHMHRPLSISPPATQQYPNPRQPQHLTRLPRPRRSQSQNTPPAQTTNPTPHIQQHKQQHILPNHKISFSHTTTTSHPMERGHDLNHKQTHPQHSTQSQKSPTHTSHTKSHRRHIPPRSRQHNPPTSHSRCRWHTRHTCGRPIYRHTKIPYKGPLRTTHPQTTKQTVAQNSQKGHQHTTK